MMRGGSLSLSRYSGGGSNALSRSEPALVYRHAMRPKCIELHDLRLLRVCNIISITGGLFALVGELVDLVGVEHAPLLEHVRPGRGNPGRRRRFLLGLGRFVLAAVEVGDFLAD